MISRIKRNRKDLKLLLKISTSYYLSLIPNFCLYIYFLSYRIISRSQHLFRLHGAVWSKVGLGGSWVDGDWKSLRVWNKLQNARMIFHGSYGSNFNYLSVQYHTSFHLDYLHNYFYHKFDWSSQLIDWSWILFCSRFYSVRRDPVFSTIRIISNKRIYLFYSNVLLIVRYYSTFHALRFPSFNINFERNH